MHQVPGLLLPKPHAIETPYMSFIGPTRPKTRVACTRHRLVAHLKTVCFVSLSKHKHVRELPLSFVPASKAAHGCNLFLGRWVGVMFSRLMGTGEDWRLLFALIAQTVFQDTHDQGRRLGYDFLYHLSQKHSYSWRPGRLFSHQGPSFRLISRQDLSFKTTEI